MSQLETIEKEKHHIVFCGVIFDLWRKFLSIYQILNGFEKNCIIPDLLLVININICFNTHNQVDLQMNMQEIHLTSSLLKKN